MVAIKKECRDDSNCSAEQYCYDVSRQCVDYTVCSRYNREEGQKPAKNPSQCGSCLPGYDTEQLGTGETAAVCRKTSENIPGETGGSHLIWTIPVVLPLSLVLIVFGVIVFGVIFLRKRRKIRKTNDPEVHEEESAEGPTAPPLESNSLITSKKSLSYVPFNNNKDVKDRNRLLNATGYNPPDWVRINPNYDNTLNNNHNEVNVLEQLPSPFETPPTNNNFSTWNPELLPQEIVIGNIPAYGIEQMDNSTNASIIERNNSPSSNTSGDSTNNNNNNSNNSNGSTSSSHNTQNSRERVPNVNTLNAHLNVTVNHVNFS